ncbi:MAG: adenylate/guanylate cyclase domain-containing protein [Desulfarculaceae bacterium]|jgi:class 3 adenylate cyclase
MPQQKTGSHPQGKVKSISARMGLMQVIANITGAGVCIFYFLVLDPVAVEAITTWDLWVPVTLTACLIILGTILVHAWEKDIAQVLASQLAGKELDPVRSQRAQRKVLQAPLMHAMVSMGNWCLAACFMSGYAVWSLSADSGPKDMLFGGLRVMMGTLVSGLATSSMVFFKSDKVFQEIRPFFFPQGGLSRVQGVFRLRVRTRLLFAFAMVSVVPMIVVAVLVYQKASAMASEGSASPVQEIVFLLAFFLATGLTLALVLSRLVSASIADPLKQMQRAMSRVEQGDLALSLPVTANDELGDLAESFNQMIEGLRERDRVKETFGRFVSPQIAKAILNKPAKLGGESTEVSVLFSDIRNYTEICEQLPPRQVIELLNGYFAYMVAAIEKHKGLVYQFVGDAIMAVFNAPVQTPDHATYAVTAALEMNQALQKFNQKKRPGRPPLQMGIGINSGPVVAGIIGSEDRMEYRVVGDTVNLAARVESLNKDLGTEILITRGTRDQLKGAFNLQAFPPISVKGKRTPVEVFALIPGSINKS